MNDTLWSTYKIDIETTNRNLLEERFGVPCVEAVVVAKTNKPTKQTNFIFIPIR